MNLLAFALLAPVAIAAIALFVISVDLDSAAGGLVYRAARRHVAFEIAFVGLLPAVMVTATAFAVAAAFGLLY